jgi:hypothetical protein
VPAVLTRAQAHVDHLGPEAALDHRRRQLATDEVLTAERLRAALDDLVEGAHRAGVLRADFTSADVPLLLEHLTCRIPVTGERATALRLRYLDLVLAGLRTPGPRSAHGPAQPWAPMGGAPGPVERAGELTEVAAP